LEPVGSGLSPHSPESAHMAKSQYYTASSLDGFIADKNNSLDWLFTVERGPNPGEEFREFSAEVGAKAMGATTYEWVWEHESLASVAPVTLGSGAPLLPRRLTASQLELVEVGQLGQFARLV